MQKWESWKKKAKTSERRTGNGEPFKYRIQFSLAFAVRNLVPVLELVSGQNYINSQSIEIMENSFFSKNNYVLILVGVGMLIIGFYALSRPPVDGFMTMSFAPIILTIAYCVVFPIAIVMKPKKSKEKD